jgi:hypothetical protein
MIYYYLVIMICNYVVMQQYTLDGYFALPPPNYLIGGYVKHVRYVKLK